MPILRRESTPDDDAAAGRDNCGSCCSLLSPSSLARSFGVVDNEVGMVSEVVVVAAGAKETRRWDTFWSVATVEVLVTVVEDTVGRRFSCFLVAIEKEDGGGGCW